MELRIILNGTTTNNALHEWQSTLLNLYDAKSWLKLCSIVFTLCFINYISSILVLTYLKVHTFHEIPRYILFIHMIINDTIQLSIVLLLHVLTNFLVMVFPLLCFLIITIASITSVNTLWNVAVMAVERFLAICYPLRHSALCTVRRSYIAIAGIWCISIIPGISDLFVVVAIETESYFHVPIYCSREMMIRSPYQEVRRISITAMYGCAVWLIVIYTYVRIVLVARAATSGRSLIMKARNTVLLHVSHLALAMVAFMTPVIESIIKILFPNYFSDLRYVNLYICFVIPRFISPLIYGIRDQHFRKHLKHQFLCRSMQMDADERIAH
ncbi:odorant receptor 131-2-like [Protopterus annectens]|uniref:odorant receptor 131-2-like n=1 Tax=Protopterus annectens TaxID=7888 RepID=UPI001CF98E4F|nr:odorant receptor 131-2-like [Protopterus annectens]